MPAAGILAPLPRLEPGEPRERGGELRPLAGLARQADRLVVARLGGRPAVGRRLVARQMVQEHRQAADRPLAARLLERAVDQPAADAGLAQPHRAERRPGEQARVVAQLVVLLEDRDGAADRRGAGLALPVRDQRDALRHRRDPLFLVSVGGSGVGEPLLRRALDALPLARERIPGLRSVVVAGPRIDPGEPAPARGRRGARLRPRAVPASRGLRRRGRAGRADDDDGARRRTAAVRRAAAREPHGAALPRTPPARPPRRARAGSTSRTRLRSGSQTRSRAASAARSPIARSTRVARRARPR